MLSLLFWYSSCTFDGTTRPLKRSEEDRRDTRALAGTRAWVGRRAWDCTLVWGGTQALEGGKGEEEEEEEGGRVLAWDDREQVQEDGKGQVWAVVGDRVQVWALGDREPPAWDDRAHTVLHLRISHQQCSHSHGLHGK